MQLFIDPHFRTFTKETYWKLSSPKRILFCFLKRILCSSFSPFLFCSIYSTDELVCIIHFSSVTFERVCSYVVTNPSSTTTMTYTVTACMLSLKCVPLFFINLFFLFLMKKILRNPFFCIVNTSELIQIVA